MMRQLTLYKFEVGTKKMVERPDGLFEKREEVATTVEATSLSKTEIRAAIIAAGVECPRGTDVFANKVGRILLKFENEDLMSIVKEREELSL